MDNSVLCKQFYLFLTETTIFLSIYLSIYLSRENCLFSPKIFKTSLYLFIYLMFYLSIFLSIYLSKYVSIYLGKTVYYHSRLSKQPSSSKRNGCQRYLLFTQYMFLKIKAAMNYLNIKNLIFHHQKPV